MNKKAKTIILIGTMCLTLFTACTSESDKKIEDLQSQVSALQDTIKENDITTTSEDLSSIIENDITLEDMKNAINEVIKQYPPEEGIELTWVENDFDSCFNGSKNLGLFAMDELKQKNIDPKSLVDSCIVCKGYSSKDVPYYVAISKINSFDEVVLSDFSLLMEESFNVLDLKSRNIKAYKTNQNVICVINIRNQPDNFDNTDNEIARDIALDYLFNIT